MVLLWEERNIDVVDINRGHNGNHDGQMGEWTVRITNFNSCSIEGIRIFFMKTN